MVENRTYTLFMCMYLNSIQAYILKLGLSTFTQDQLMMVYINLVTYHMYILNF